MKFVTETLKEEEEAEVESTGGVAGEHGGQEQMILLNINITKDKHLKINNCGR